MVSKGFTRINGVRNHAVRNVATLAFTFAVATGAINAQPAAKAVFTANGLSTPIGIAYSPLLNKLLVTQPFCGVVSNGMATGFNVAAIDASGNVTPFQALPPVPLSGSGPDFGHSNPGYNNCFEFYIAVSPGLGGFPANDIFVTQGSTVLRIPAAGGAPTFFATVPATDTETSISFDTVGTFCNQMIITGADGRVSLVSSTGAVTSYATIPGSIGSTGGAVAAESATVAPLTFTPYGGWLIVGVEDTPAGGGPFVAAVQPPTKVGNVCSVPGGGAAVYRIANQSSPEAVLSIPSTATSCEFGNRTKGSLFSITYTGPVSAGPGSLTGTQPNPYQIVAYSGSGFSGLTGDIFVANEDKPPVIDVVLTPGGAVGGMLSNAPASFDMNTTAPTYMHEGSTFVGCPINLGCVLSQGGYKNNFKSKVIGLTIGCRGYSASQVSSIIGQGGGGINALGRQLATALLNQHYGAYVPTAVQNAIDAANKLICDAVGNDPLKTIFNVSVSNSDALTQLLDDFNNGKAPGGPKTECTN